jgi:type 1 glutamine amidotransferase
MGLSAAAAAAIGLALLAAPASGRASAPPRRPLKHVLVISATKGFRHDSIPVADDTIRMLGRKTGEWDTDVAITDDDLAAKTTAAALRKYDAVIFVNTTGVLPLAEPQALLAYVRAGHGFGAIHSGADTFHLWPDSPRGSLSAYVRMLGGEFVTHHPQSKVAGRIVDPNFPGCKALIAWGKAHKGQAPPDIYQHTYVDAKGWHGFDEMYLFKNVDLAHLHALVQMDSHPFDMRFAASEPPPWLIAWCKAYGQGRVFYCSFGHRQEMWRDPLYREFITGGIRWMLGLAAGSTTPNLH